VKDVPVADKQNPRVKDAPILPKKLQKQKNVAEAPGNPYPGIKIVDLPGDPAVQKPGTWNNLKQLEQKVKNLIHEQQVMRSNFGALFEGVPNAVIIVDKNRHIVKANQNFITLSGYQEAELSDKLPITSLFLKKDRKKIEQLLKKVESNGQFSGNETVTAQCLCKDKTTRLVELNFASVPAQNQVMIFLTDITDKTERENGILKRNRELTVLNSISRSITQPKDLQQILNLALEKIRMLVGTEMGVIYLGNRFIKNLQPVVTYGMSHEDAKKLLLQNISLVKEIKKERKNLFLNPSNGILWEFFNKQPKCRSIAMLPLYIRKNSFGILALTSKKQIEFDEEKRQLLAAIGHQLVINIENAVLFNELEAKTKEVEAKNKELSSFVFTVSHDLKTPLIALHGYLNLFYEEFQQIVDNTGKEYLERILYNAEYMDKMINDLLRLSRAGRVVGNKRRFSSAKLVREVYMCFYQHIRQKQINFIISKNLPVIYGDRQRLQTVFENLIGNAIKYASEKRDPFIEIDCKERKNWYEFMVRDNGIGIDTADHQRIFEVFQKCDKKNEKSNGTGVGLTIVKKIIEHHGGTVWVESKLDKGSTFYFTLPRNST